MSLKIDRLEILLSVYIVMFRQEYESLIDFLVLMIRHNAKKVDNVI